MPVAVPAPSGVSLFSFVAIKINGTVPGPAEAKKLSSVMVT